jgi:hypothetical protein
MKFRIEPCESWGKYILEVWNGTEWVTLHTDYLKIVEKMQATLEAADKASFKLTDEFHQDEPLGYLVKNYDVTIDEYEVFCHEGQAKDHARQQQSLTDYEDRYDDRIFPLYAGDPIR